MAIVFDPFTGQIIDTGSSISTTSIGGPVAGADPNSVLVVDSSLTLQNVQMPDDGQLLIGSSGNLPVAAKLTSNGLSSDPNRIIITNGPGSIDLNLPQDINTTSSPTFANLYLPPNGTIDLNAAGILNIGTTASTVINIGNAGADVNIYGDTVYQNVTNLNVTDKNITLNNGGSAYTSFNSGLHIYDDGIADRGYFEVSIDMLGWNMKAPYANGVIHFENGATGFTIDQGSHNPITIATPANGLAVDGNQELSIALADISTTGALSSTDWNTFNEKVDRAGDTMSGNLNMETTGTPGEILTISSDGLSSNIETQITTEGNLFLTTQNLVGSNTGDITIQSGDAVGSDYAGSIYLNGGSNVDGNPANIELTAGVSSGTGSDGSIILNAKNIVYLNQNLNGSIFAGPDSLNLKRIENVADPQADQDAATKKWTKDLSILSNVLYVSTTGSIFTGNGSLFDPYDSIATALAAASNGDLIALLPGTYNEPTVVIPNTLSDIHFSGMLSGATIVTNGFSYTSLASSVNIQFDQINVGQLTLDATLALNGLIEITRCNFSLNRSDNNGNVLVKSSECTVFGGTVNGTFNATECLFVVSPDVYSGLSIFENCKYVSRIEAHGNCIVRMLDCELFGATEFINGTVVGIDTPTWQVDLSTEYLGGYTGSVNKVILANISAGTALATYYDISSVTLPLVDPYSPDGTAVITGDKVLFGALTNIPDRKIYIATVSAGSISWSPDSSYTPETGSPVCIQSGDVFGLQTGKFDGTNYQFNDFVRYFNGSDYWEESALNTVQLLNNTLNNIFTINSLNSENIIIDYSISRGTKKVTGTLHLTSFSTQVDISDTGIELNGPIGVSFSASISSGQLILDCQLDNSGNDGFIKFTLKRWSDLSGGPASIPSYSINPQFTIKEISSVNPVEVYTNITTIEFDNDTGLGVDLTAPGTVKITSSGGGGGQILTIASPGLTGGSYDGSSPVTIAVDETYIATQTYVNNRIGVGGGGKLVPPSYPLTLLVDDNGKVVYIDTSASRTINLPAPQNGWKITLKDVTGNSSANPFTIVRNGSEKIEGLSSNYICQSDFGVWTLFCDGTDYILI